MIKILKFGGTSVGTPEAIKQTIQIVLKEQKKKNYPVVVVSRLSCMVRQDP